MKQTETGMEKRDFLLYGCYGYTGRLIAESAAQAGLRPLLAGRNAERTKAVAEQTGFPYLAFDLDERKALDQALQQCSAVLHAAGPFVHTLEPMLDACLRTGTHYLDITGEMPVFERAKAQSENAKKAGIMLMPGAGFDVVPSDCLACYLAERMPEAESLTLALYSPKGQLSHGTALTMLEHAADGGAIRENGKIKHVPHAWDTRSFDFGFKQVQGVTIPWGDLSTAWTSTGIPNIRVYNAMPPSAAKSLRRMRWMAPLTRFGPVKRFLQKRIKQKPAGPDEQRRAAARSYIWGEVRKGKAAKRAYLDLPDGYSLTAQTALEILRRIQSGQHPIGYQTPSTAYGADLILGIPETKRVDL